jgi:hypothetical protein
MSNPTITVIALPTFTRNIRTLIKKYRHILKDIQPIIEQLENGEILGEQLSGVGYPVFNLRIKNSDNVFLLTLYSKSEQDDVMAGDLKDIIEEYECNNRDNS